MHDGALDIIRGPDLVTVSWNSFSDHDKTMLIGSTNTPAPTSASCASRCTTTASPTSCQRLPRVRFGQVDVYNNYYEVTDEESYGYSLGVGVGSQIFSESNFYRLSRAVDPAKLLYDWGGTAITTRNDVLRVGGTVSRIDLVAVYNAAEDPDLSPDAGWTPALHTGIDPAASVRLSVSQHAGVGEVR